MNAGLASTADPAFSMLLSMRVIIFGATGMVGQGVLRECLLDPDITSVLAVGRSPVKARDAKLQELVMPDMMSYAGVESKLSGYDACFFCLGVSSAGMAEAQYRHVTYDLTLAAATALARLLGPFIPAIKALAPNAVTSTEIVGRAMIEVAKHGAPSRILETKDINATIMGPSSARHTR